MLAAGLLLPVSSCKSGQRGEEGNYAVKKRCGYTMQKLKGGLQKMKGGLANIFIFIHILAATSVHTYGNKRPRSRAGTCRE
jgi:hypothetical protein